jgi:ketosteroid isomerase-like protein
MSEENVEIVRRGYRLYAAGDLEGVAALFADDAEVSDTAGLGTSELAPGTRRGPEGSSGSLRRRGTHSRTSALSPRTSSTPAKSSSCPHGSPAGEGQAERSKRRTSYTRGRSATAK